MNTSLPRMFSLKRTETSPSSKRDTTASPTGTFRRLQIADVSLWLDVPEKMRQGSKANLRFAAWAQGQATVGAEPACPGESGWGGRIRTSECGSQSPVPYRLATPHQRTGYPSRTACLEAPGGVKAAGPECGKSGGQLKR